MMRIAGIWSIASLLALSFACGAGGKPAPAAPKQPTAPPDVAKAALPFAVLAARGGREVSLASFYDELGKAQAVCIGEQHPDPHYHWAQLQILDELSRRQQAAGLEGALGLEMIQRPFQGVLDDYMAGKIDEATMLARVGWKKRWGYDFALYRPMIRLAKERGLALLALNTVKELTKKVSRKGLDSLTESEALRLPELDLRDENHRAWFFALMEGMGGAGAHGGDKGAGADTAAAEARADRIYTAQVLWDETMASTAADWLAGGARRQIVILAGGGHCHDSAIVGRLRRRGAAPVLSVQPVVDDGEGSVADVLAMPKNDFVFAMKGKEGAASEASEAKEPKERPPHPMPPGHPKTGGEERPPHPMPPGHPKTGGEARPPHPMPPGHPKMGGEGKPPHPMPPESGDSE